MLDALRRGVGTWVAKVFIGLLVMSFAIWGISDVFTGFGNNSVAQVGDTEISSLEFETAYRRQLDNLSQQLNQPITPEQGAAFGIPTQVLSQLLAEAALNDVASNLKLGVSDEAIVRTIQENPAFRGINGAFDRSRLAMVLRNAGISEDEFVLLQQDLAERQQLIEALVGDLIAPEALVTAFHNHITEERRIAYLRIDESNLDEIPTPTDEELKSYFEDNIDRYRAPEYRQVNYLEITPKKIANPSLLTEEQVREEYERVKDRYQLPEQRRVLQMSFPTLEEAETAAAELQGNKTFEDLLSERDLEIADVDLGMMGRAGFLDDSIAEAAFQLNEGETSGAVEGRFTNVILKVQEIQPESVEPFEEVADEIRSALAEDLAADEIYDLYNEIEDARAGGSSFNEVAERFDLDLVQSPLFDQSGQNPDEQAVDLPVKQDLIAATFDSDVGIENDPINIGRNGYLWFEVARVDPERERSLEEVRAKVVADWTAHREAEQLKQLSEEILAEIEAGKTLEAVATARELTVQNADGLTREQPTELIGAEALQAIFSGPVGTTAEVSAQDGSRLVLQVADTTTPAQFTESPQMRNMTSQLSADLQNSLVSQFIARVEQEAGVRVNQTLFNQISGMAAQ
ncbi:SurA N-terminal domain-containing protein [Pseudovibrio exalbescens]|uniref:Parvulin-like PPIase n=1 Tax=Pseudovibrio exalbescens TaxID=197461 RepID=A0A1U7JFQ9_9HYPH|nr:SurA N-terminal domain-containing protein [Pseudovibrio exalbescens]OKL43524.1 peptidylprolyl isomerase [Pseudovibrio exalbescens]